MRRLLVLLLISGCTTSLAPEDFCAQQWIARCQANKRCRHWSPAMECPIPPDTACAERLQSWVDAGVFTYDGTAAKKCLDAFERRSCDELYDEPLESGDEACDRYLVGTRKEGESCGGCQAGLVCINNSTGCGTCSPKPAPAEDGESCASRPCGSTRTARRSAVHAPAG